MTNALIIGSMSAMGLMATFLVLDKKYEDGLVGRFALVGMIMMSLIASLLALEHVISDGALEDVVNPKALLVVFMISMTVFMGRHVYRYIMYRCFGEGDWRGKGK
jgi:hypothetical protein